ncbi:hypothetical protein EVAR_75645_1 [Eumeta japonica]|uniref:Uncharacterized protein n=1 Tax=Eumeta variegata TaxID=151549 RepID=A0A4C1U009_EUMVA|nr:hypothetical protein EVAR_75645_1 [Eumeta japonica]
MDGRLIHYYASETKLVCLLLLRLQLEMLTAKYLRILHFAPNLVTSGFYLFSRLKEYLKGQMFEDYEAIVAAV